MRLSTPLSSRARLLLPAALGASLATNETLAQTPEAASPVASPAASPVAGSDWLGIATTMWETIQEYLYIPEEALYLERTPKGEDDRNFSYLWPYASLLSGITNLASISPEHEAAREQAFESLQRYYDDSVEPVGYDSYVVDDGGGDKFYDDNEWLGIDFVHAYRATGNATYLDRAVITWNFAISGWTDTLGGGIHWKQYDMSTKNTCSNGPAAVLALLLYAETEEQEYLDWAVRIMEWVAQLKDPATGVYRDNIHVEGRIEPMTWTYNTGTPMHANALLYEATGDEAWLQEARDLAEASLAHFAPP